MAERVKTRRRYDSPRRREQAAATRRAILEAAERLFQQDGYAATSMAAVAAEADVSLKTVYLAFETKSGVLRALWHLRLRGDEDPIPVGRREWFREVMEEPDPERQLRLHARNSRMVKVRAGLLMQIIRDGAAGDPDIAALWNRIQTDFYDNQRSVVESLDEKGALRAGLGVDRATDILWTINHPALYWLLAGDRGWTPEQFEEWLLEAVRSQLLEQRR
jgi:AcrR family transcriptional regulator